MAEKIKLNNKQRRRLRNLRQKTKAGDELNDKQQGRFRRLREQRQQVRAFNKTDNPKELRGEAAVQDLQAGKQIQYANADQYNPFGSQTVRFNPVTGAYETRSALSEGQEQIKSQGESLTQQGQQLAGQNLAGYNPFQFQSGAERDRIENEVFGRLNRDTEMMRQRERQSKEQELYNKGIPYSDDPNSRYQKELGDINRRFDDVTAQNRQSATMFGGQELQRSYGMDLGVHQQGMQDTTALQGMGTGLMLPQFQGFQGANYNLSNPTDIKMGFDQLALQRELGQGQLGLGHSQLALQKQAIAQNAQNQEDDIYE